MAIYHCSVQVISRSTGRSAVAAAAYRSGEKLINEYDGIEHDYTKKNWIEHTEIILCENAPIEYSNREVLWNAVEKIEKTQDAQLCREFELALPKEMTLEQQIELVRQFSKEALVSQGMIVDFAVHCPPVTNDRHQAVDVNGNVTRDKTQMLFQNPHAHILATMRPLDEKGKWMNKTEKEYLCMKGVEERGFTAKEFQLAKEEGWEKQYRYTDGKEKQWLTTEEGNNRGWARVNNSPKTTPYGRRNEKTEYWNNEARVAEWRKQWEVVVNRAFERMHSDVRIDCRSYRAQGRTDVLPTIHMGTSACCMEKRAARELTEGKTERQVAHSDIGSINRQIKMHNHFVRELKRKLEEITKKTKTLVEKIASQLEGLRAKLIGNEYETTVLHHRCSDVKKYLSSEQNRLEGYGQEADRIKEAERHSAEKIKGLQKQLKECTPFQMAQKKRLQEQIQEEQEKIESRKEYFISISQKYGYANSEEYATAKKEYAQSFELYGKMENAMNFIEENTKELIAEYREELSQIYPEIEDELVEAQKIFREDSEQIIQTELQKKHKEDYSEKIFSEAKKKTDKLIKDAVPLTKVNLLQKNAVFEDIKKIVTGRKR